MPIERKITEQRVAVDNPGREDRLLAIKATQIVWLLFGILEALIALRIGLKLIAANPNNLVVTVIYGFTELFLWPFQGITISPSMGNFVLEIPSVIALLIYALLAWVVERLVWVIFYRPRERMEEVTETSTHEERRP